MQHDDWLAYVLSRFLGFSGEALRMLSPDADPADRWMLIRRLAEYQVLCDGDDADCSCPDRHDAWRFQEYWDHSDTELRNAELTWLHRYDERPASLREHCHLNWLLEGRIRPDEDSPVTITGLDGTFYLPARKEPGPGGPGPVLVAVTDAGILEVITGFRDQGHRRAWLADREHGRAPDADGLPAATLPVDGAADDPDCLARYEEQVLTWILTEPDAAREIAASLDPHSFSAPVRAEIFQSWRAAAAADPEPSLATVRHQLARRLLRAPEWAGRSVGWPFGHLGLAYFDRLAVTEAAREQALAAICVMIIEAVGPRKTAPVTPLSADTRRRSPLARAAARGLAFPWVPGTGGPAG